MRNTASLAVTILAFARLSTQASEIGQWLKVSNTTSGKAGLCLFQIGDRQEYDNFELSRTPLVLPTLPKKALSTVGRDAKTTFLSSDEYRTPNVPSPQDWVLVLERVETREPSRVVGQVEDKR
jgi:hypothetical protein